MEENIEALVERLSKVKNEKTSINNRLKELNGQEEYLESLLITTLQEQGLNKASTEAGTVSIKTDDYPTIEDWDMFWEYIKDNNMPSIIKKSVNSKIWKSYLEQGVSFPGLSSYEKTVLSFRKKS